jgi:hypothetical protein
MKEKPILFSGPMVKAILEGRKTQTRRIMKPQPGLTYGFIYKIRMESGIPPKCPYGKIGDHLWVRETWADVNTPDGPAICYRADSSYMYWRDFSKEFGPDYGAGPSMNYEKYPGNYTMWWEDLLSGEEGHGWKPSIHMPRWASRITLKIIDIRVEGLQDITEDDAITEGSKEPSLVPTVGGCLSERDVFAKLWDSINEKRGYGWNTNPWVWVIEFERQREG